MARPGTSISIRETSPPRSAPTDTSVWFVTGISDRGPTTPTEVKSMTDYARLYGPRVSTGILYDVLDTFFREGGAKAIISRVVGPAAVIAFKNLLDAGAGISLIVQAKNAGAWGNALRIAVIAPDVTGFKLQVSTVADGILETSGDLANQAQAVEWGQYSNYINVVLGATALNPALLAAAPLATGNDDIGAVTEAHWKIALDKFTVDLGPGQVSHPGRTTTQGHLDVLAHAKACNRAALLDAADTATKATLMAAAAAVRTNGRHGALFGPWVKIPGITAGTTRTVPPSPVIAGLIARVDPVSGAGTPAAGEQGQARYAIDLTQNAWDDTTRQDLNATGFNALIEKYGGIRNYGWRSVADPVADPSWIQFSNWRLAVDIVASLDPILEQFLFDVIDGQGFTISQFGGAITAELIPFWSAGHLYGANPSEAFNVNVGDQVNTPATIAAGEIHAVVAVRMSPFAELVQLELVKRSITQAVA